MRRWRKSRSRERAPFSTLTRHRRWKPRAAARISAARVAATPRWPNFLISLLRSPTGNVLSLDFRSLGMGRGPLIVSTAVARRRALFVLAFTLVVGATRFVTEGRAAGAFAIGKCGAFGQ